ncbi:hypothetical protein [Streptomyces sp. FIT100]|uniref:hypothetical protein n=1 Tax=Streptomyces sp. FIT100 TaxID=2837956 RepID=UPI0021FE2444|nr:hypothetical protein KK483_20070 [Streptomyces sp. FIT100]
MAGLAAFGLLAAGCSTGGTGARDEGPARTDPVAQTPSTTGPSTTASPVKKVDAVRLVMADPKVSDRVKADLKRCAGDAYPIDTSYGNLTSSPVPDVVVNVLTCGDAVGVGTFVYREDDDSYENVFGAEEPAVYSTIDRGDLIVTRQVYAKGDPVSYPSGEIVVTYRWTGNRFVEHDRVENEYSRSVDGGIAEEPVPSAAGTS